MLSQHSLHYALSPSPSEWISDYEDSVLDPEALRMEVDAFMEAYDKKIAEEEAKAKEEEGVPDEEGWVKVTRRGCRPMLPQTEAASLRVLEKEKRKRARKELLNFYAWQHRETKMERKTHLRAPPHPGAGSRVSPATSSMNSGSESLSSCSPEC